MRVVPQRMTDVWRSGQFTGRNRPIARVTIQRTHVITRTVGKERYASYLFGNPSRVLELPNVKSVQWSRSIDTDAATATITLYNTKALPIGVKPPDDDYIYNQPGWLTFNRGLEPNRWDHEPNMWTKRLYPDMLIRTYEGYGYDPTVGPELDENQMPSGVWLIDDVVLGADGTLVLKCRDAARLLLDQIAFVPVVPRGLYPLKFTHFHEVANPKVPVVSKSGGMAWINPTYYADSGEPYLGRNGSIGGHRPSDAFDGSDETYWLSIGNGSPTSDYAYEWIEGTIPKQTVAAVRCHVRGGPYRVYVSCYVAGKGWAGSAVVPYNPDNPVSAPNGSNIPYIRSATVGADSDVVVDVKDTANVERVRVTFHDLWDSNYGTYQYRAAVYDFDVLVAGSATKTTWVSAGTHTEGNYADFTDIAKYLLGYAGFLWPSSPVVAYQNTTDGQVPMVPPNPDDVLLGLTPDKVAAYHAAGKPPIGEIWGDLEQSGTYGPADLTIDIFDKRPLADGISYIRDMLGFISYCDESGAAIFRSPNVWSRGNWRTSPGHRLTSSAVRTHDTVVIDERQTLMGLQATLSSRSIRERIVIANAGGSVGAVTKGFLPYHLPAAGLRRVAIWTDQHFKSRKECQIMADLIAVRQLFSYRTDTITIPGYPAIQIDDQVKLVEEVTEEMRDLHYVKSISSTLDMSTGTWKYEVGTHWLGDEPFGKWAFDPNNLAQDTLDYLVALGKL